MDPKDQKVADDRAHRIASIAAEDLLRSAGEPTSAQDHFAIPQCQVDDHMLDCIEHLRWHGEAASYETEEGYLVVQFGEFPIERI